MLTPGNRKLGERLIWSFGLPSGTADVCVGMTSICHKHCYARRLERFRPHVHARYVKNLQLSRLSDFAKRVYYFILNQEIQVVRIHISGDFYSAAYIQKWLHIIRKLPPVRFYTYTRSWRLPRLLQGLLHLADRPNCAMWFSCDRETGVPEAIPAHVRLAWLMTDPADLPPAPMHLVFRVKSLRQTVCQTVNDSRVCPGEDGVPRPHRMTCDRCQSCFQPADPQPRLLHLPTPRQK